VANPISRQLGGERESGFQSKGAYDEATVLAETLPDPEQLEAEIQAHNQELLDRAAGHFELPLVVLTEQDRFIGILMTEHEAKLSELRADCERLKCELEASHATERDALAEHVAAASEEGWDEPELEALQQALDAANAEIDETRADALRLQEERDDAIRATDDVRLELMSELESARDEAFQLETRLDEAHRLVEDARDQARSEVQRLTEELSDLRAELAARNDELQRFRERLSIQTGSATRPGPLPRRSAV
jgi:chromosome segregation ATPase